MEAPESAHTIPASPYHRQIEDMKDARSGFIEVRGLNIHCRAWGEEDAPKLFLLHGFQDASASWQFTVDALERDWHVIAPDWRGYGLSEWNKGGCYWSADMIADLDVILDTFEPEYPARVVAHSMGANIAALHAGVRPDRIHRFVNIEGFGGQATFADDAPRRIAKWMQQMSRGERQRPYDSYEEFAERMMAENPHLTPWRAEFMAAQWGQQEPDGTVTRRADPAHKLVSPMVFSFEEACACWNRIEAPVLWVEGRESLNAENAARDPERSAARLAAYRTLAGVEHVAGAGHNVHHDQPEALARLIEGFV